MACACVIALAAEAIAATWALVYGQGLGEREMEKNQISMPNGQAGGGHADPGEKKEL